MSDRGRPSKYKPEFVHQAKVACEAGFTDRELADLFEVSEVTINTWKVEHPEFSLALKEAKNVSDQRVERSLYHRAIGYTFDSVKIFPPKASGEPPLIVPYREHVPPDATSMIFWLKNRQPGKWRDVHKHEHGAPGEFDDLTDEQLRERITAVAGEPDRGGKTRRRVRAPSGPKTLQ